MMIENEQIKGSVLTTIAYYDAFDFPLTSFEIFYHLINFKYFEEVDNERVSLERVIKELEWLVSKKRSIEMSNGFYFLKGRKKIASVRIRRNKKSVQKMRRLKKSVSFLRMIPFIRMVCVTGRLSMKNVWIGSDWDLLIVFEKGRIWTGRTLVTIFLHIFGKRRYRNKISDRICLNYFLTDQSLEISTKDLFSSNEYYFMQPLFDAEKNYRKFQLKNSWIKKFKPNYELNEIDNFNLMKDNGFYYVVRYLAEAVLGWNFVETGLRKWEKAKIKKNPKTQKVGSMIEASDSALIFLPDPKGPKIFEKFKENMDKL